MIATSETLKSFLSRTPFFAGLDDTSLDRIAEMLVESHYASGSHVFKSGDTGRSMYVIARGEIVLCRGAGTHPIKLTRLKVGDFFGETTLIEMQPRPHSALVTGDATLYELTNVELYRLYHEDVRAYVLVLQNINRELCRRLRKASERIIALAEESGDSSTQIRAIPYLAPSHAKR